MVTERRPKTGYWRINPQTGEAEWIEGSYQPPKPETIKQPEISVGEIAPVPPPPVAPLIIPPQPPGSLLSPEAWRELNIPSISSEEWLAKWEAPIQAQREQKAKELETTLRAVYPEMFDPTRSFGFTEDQIPVMVVEQLGLRMQEDYEGFLQDLTARVGSYEAENILRQFGVQEEFILQGLDVQEQEQRILGTIQAVLPEMENLESFGNLIETDWESFFETIRTGGGNTQKRQLLELIGFAPEEINEIFMRPRLVVEVDGIRRLLDIDLVNKTAYDLEGNYIGMYNPATKEFTKASPRNVLQKAWDWLAFSSRQYWELGESALIGILPELIYADIPEPTIKLGWNEEVVNFLNETNRQQRENWRFAYRENKREYEDWLGKNPQIQPSKAYQEGAFQNPELLKDPMYYVYEFTNILPLVLATATIGVGTGGVGLPFFAISTGMMGAVEGGGVYQDLLDAGAPEDKAAGMAAIAGGIIGSLESVGRIPLLKQISPLVFGQFKREAARGLARQGLAQTIKQFGRNFTVSMFAETLTEVAQEIVGNVAVSVYDKNRSIFENVPDIAVKTAVGMAGFGLFGAGVSTRMVTPSELRGLSDAAKRAKGWVTDNKGNWYEKVKEVVAEERGAIGRPAVTLKKLATPAETELLKTSQTQATKVGLDLEAIEGIARGEYWVALTTSRKGKGEFTEWLIKLRNENPEKANLVEKALVGKFEFKETEPPYGRGRFLPFKSIQDAQKFLETGDLSFVAKSINLKGSKWTPAQLEQTKQTLAEWDARNVPITNQIKVLNDKLEANQTELANLPKDLPLEEWKVRREVLQTEIDSLRKQITDLGMQRLRVSRELPEVTPAEAIKPGVTPPTEAVVKPSEITPVTPEVTRPTVTKATQYSIDKVDNALKNIEDLAPKEAVRESAVRRRQLVSAYESLELHARKLGVPIPKLGTFYNPGQYLSNARQMLADVQKSYKLAPEPAIPKAEAGMLEAVIPATKTEIVETAIEQTRQTEPVAPPPPTDGARKVYERIEFEPEHENFMDKIRRGWHRFNVTMVDELFAIKQLVDQLRKGGIELSIEENPYLTARLLKGVASKANVFLETGTFGKKFWKMEKGKAVPNFTGESLETILQEVKDPQVWRDFSTYLVAKRTIQLSARNIETGIELGDAQSAISELETKYNNFFNLAERVYKYQDNLLVYANEMGLMSGELLEKLRKFGDYVPFYRVMNELQAKGLMGKKMANIAQPIKKIKGSEREIINPLESIVKNTYVIINSADRNQVGIMLANLADKFPQVTEVFERVKTPIARVAGVTAKELGVEIEGMTDADAEAIIDIFRPSFFTRGDEVTVLIDGKKQYFKVDADLRNGLLNLDAESLGMLGKIFGAPARWLRAGATLSPDFMVRNPARDQMTAFAYSNYGFIPGIDFLRGLASIIAKDTDYQLYRQSGAEHAMLVSMDRDYLQKTFKEIVEGRNFTFYVKHPMELLRIVSELGEKATRLGEFKAGIRRGAMPLEAGYSSRAVTLDFSQMGTTARAANTLIAFFNANIRGWGRMVSSFKEHPMRTSAKVFMGITMPSILLYYANRDDERWKEIPQWQKDLFWIVFVGDNIYRIPKPFELGIIFGSMPERFLEWLDNKDPKLFKEALANLIEAGSPGFIPTAGLPILEWMTNYSFFRGTKLVPSSREKMPPELQYLPYTSEFSKKIGELIKQPPAKIDNLINGYTAGLGRYAVDVLDEILKGTGIASDIPEPSPTLVDRPIIKAFVVRNPYGSSGATVERFYDTLTEFEQGEKYLKEMLELGNEEKFEEYKAKHPELLFFYELSEDPEKEGVSFSSTARYLRRVARDLTELRKKQDAIYKDKVMSPEEKRRLIDEIDMLKTDVARKALNLFIDEPKTLQSDIDQAIGRLGEVIEDEPVLSLVEPDIFNMRKLYTEFGNILEVATPDDLSKLEGIDKLAFNYLETKAVKKEVDPLLNKKIYEIKPELKEGVTFESYYQSWKRGVFKDEDFDNLSRRQLELLVEYNKLDKPGQKQFLIDHPELNINPTTEWLKSHPKENAQLAVWGQAKLLSKASYDEFNRLINEFDIADNALPEMTLPPKGSTDNYFKYQDMESKNSWEAQLLLANDPDLLKFLGRQPIETPLASLELKVKNRANFDKLEVFSDRDSPDYIADDRVRAEAIKEFKVANPEFVDDTRRIEAIEKGTDETPIDDTLVNAHVEYGKLIDKEDVGSSSAEVMLYRVDNPGYDAFRTDANIWGDQALKPVDQSKIPIWRIDVKYRKEDAEYDALVTSKERQEYLDGNPEYRIDRRRREAYSLTNSATGETLPTELVESYVAYYEYPDKGKRRERFLVENPDFANAMHRIAGIDLPDPAKVPSVEYDNIYDEWIDEFGKFEGLADNTSEFYIEDPIARQSERDRMRYTSGKQTYSGVTIRNKVLTGFGLAEIKREAYGKFVPDEHIDTYVQWGKIQSEGKPKDWDNTTKQGYWFEDDWFLMENQEFYKDVYLGLLGNERKDFRKVPSRLVFEKYLVYVRQPHQTAKKEYRATNPDLEEWGTLRFGWTPIKEQEIREELTPYEKFMEEFEERQREIEERIEALR